MKRRYSIFADYHQFYLWDARVAPDAPTDYSDDDIAKRIKAAPNIVVIQPERNMQVPVELEVLTEAPPLSFDKWDHIAEASLDLPSGELEVHECTGGSIDRIAVAAGSYRVRAHFGGLDSLSPNGLEGGDHYAIAMWPAPSSPPSILKWHRPRNVA
jgi:hypothetical protein